MRSLTLNGGFHPPRCAFTTGKNVTAEGVQRLWQRLLNEDLSTDAAEEMIFEGDLDDCGFLNYANFADSLRSVHDAEIVMKESEQARR